MACRDVNLSDGDPGFLNVETRRPPNADASGGREVFNNRENLNREFQTAASIQSFSAALGAAPIF